MPTSESPPDPRHLTKSRVIAGLQCARRAWLQVHAPIEREGPAPGSLGDLGRDIGILARQLFAEGVLVDAEPWAHDEACRRTQALLADPRVPAIFEAGFTADGIRVRVDVLERLPRGRWGLREVKMSTGVKDTHLDDLAIQLHVLRRCGLDIASVELVHIDDRYVRAATGLDPAALFRRVDCAAALEARLARVAASAADLLVLLQRDVEPAAEPSSHCFSPHACAYWDRCTAGKPKDWVFHLPHARAALRQALALRAIERIADIPDDVPLSPVQARLRAAIRRGGLVVEPGLAGAVAGLAPPMLCLDFETLAPPVPLYPGTRPYQQIPVQWSLHVDDGSGPLRHHAFLADGDGDPRRAFVSTLLDALDREAGPIAVYSSYEAQQLGALARVFPDLAPRLDGAIARLVDLLPIMRAHVAHPDFRGSFSIKTVAPVLAPEITYADLDTIGDGEQASSALYALAAGKVATQAERRRLRTALERYCARDTQALMALTRAVRRLAAPHPSSAHEG